ncbi:MAG: hypothetical protein U0457_04425 [Candidatus Sericytochromatia bacterium]
MKKLRGIILLLILPIFSCQLYILPTFNFSNIEKWDIDYSKFNYPIHDMAIDSMGNVYITSVSEKRGFIQYYVNGKKLDDKIFKITPSGKISEFFIYDENNEDVDIFPKIPPNNKKDRFILYYDRTSFIIKNDYLYTYYQYFSPSFETGFCKFNLKTGELKKFPIENIDFKFNVDKNDNIYEEYSKNKNILKPYPYSKDNLILYSNNNREIFKITKDNKQEKIFLNKAEENILFISNEIKSFVEDSQENIYFIVSKYTIGLPRSNVSQILEPYIGSFNIISEKYLHSSLYKLTKNNSVYSIKENITSYENIKLDEKNNILYFYEDYKKEIYKLKL